MPKRAADERITRYREKIRKIEEQKQPRRRRRVIYSDSSDSDEIKSQTNETENVHVETCPGDVVVHNEPLSGTAAINQPGEVLPASPTAGIVSEDPDAAAAAAPDLTTALDPEILSALGAQPEDELEYGPKIHDNLSQLWLPLLKKGMPKEEKEKITKDYLVPENCKLLQAPKLNLEIAAAVSESARGRDKKLSSAQQQLGVGISAVNRALDTLITKDENCAVKAIKHLSDACRVLCDLHYIESQARIKLITPNLDKNFLNIIQQDSCRDETLFGVKLAEKIKSSKTIEKQGLQIKKATAPSSAPSASTSRPAQSRGNWSGPPRYSTNRGGRGSGKKTSSSSRKPPPPPATTTTAKPFSKQTRAPTHQ